MPANVENTEQAEPELSGAVAAQPQSADSRRAARLDAKLAHMRGNPKADWKIGDIESVCARHGLNFSNPTRGSHYKVSSPKLQGNLPIPARRPIKTIYIKKFVALVDAHVACDREGQSDE